MQAQLTNDAGVTAARAAVVLVALWAAVAASLGEERAAAALAKDVRVQAAQRTVICSKERHAVRSATCDAMRRLGTR